MSNKTVSAIMLTLFITSMLTFAFDIQPAKTNSITYTRTYLPNEWVSDGAAMDWHGDDASWPYTLPFNFPFYGDNYTTIYISSNGMITFLYPDSSLSNSIPSLAGKLTIVPAWDDWIIGDDIYIWQPDSDHVIIRWQVVAYYDTNVFANFETVLGSDGVIKLNYGQNNGLISATVGISNGAGEILAEDVTDLNYINTILFTPFRPEHDLEVNLEAPTFLRLGQSTILNATVSNLGSNNETSVELQLLVNGSIVDSDIIPELLTGSSHTLSYSWTPTGEGVYNVTVYASPVTDETIIENNIATGWTSALTIESTFREDFDTPTLDPHWQVWRYGIPAPSPSEATYQQETMYSLTDNPGYLKYYLGSMTCWAINEPQYNGPGSPYWYYPSMHLYRMFESTDWILETRVTYNAPNANAPISVTYIFFGDPQQGQGWKNNSIVITGAAWDGYHQVYVVENGNLKGPTNLPINQYGGDTFYYKVIRSGHQVTLQWSRDSITFTTAFTETMGSQIDGLPQGVGITGQAFWSDTSTHSEYDYIYLTPPPEHELAVSLETTSSIKPGRSSSLNATVYNYGLSDESDVELQLLINGTEVSSVVIPNLPNGSSYTLSYLWTPTIEGIYNVTAYAPPMPDEDVTANNWRIEFVGVFEMVKVVILDSYGSDYAGSFWDYLNSNWATYGGTGIVIDYASLNKENMSLDDLINSGADVLIISDAWSADHGWEYTDSEIQAIKEYVRMGHGIIATAGSFDTYTAQNNRNLADLFGMDSDISYQWGADGEQKSTTGPFELRTPRHSELWLSISDPYESAASVTMYPESTSDWTQQGITNGWLEAMTSDGLAAIITSEDVFHRSVYITTIPEESHNTNDEQLLYNAIVWTSTTPQPHTLQGDINRDGIVDMKDIGIAASSFGSYPGHPRWNSAADLNADGKIDLKDVALVAKNFGKTYP